MNIWGVLGIVVLAAVAGVLLREYSPAIGLCFSIGAVCVLALVWMDEVVGIVTQLRTLLSKTKVETALFGVLLKTLGICYLCQFAGDLCKDAGETALAGYVELAGKVSVVVLSLPLITKVVETVVKLIEL